LTATVGEGGVEHVTIQLVSAPGIEVTLRKATDDRIMEQLDVYCVETSDIEPPTLSELTRGHQIDLVVWENQWQEVYPSPIRFVGLWAGQYLLVLVRDDKIIASKSCVVGKEPVKLDFEFPARPRDSYLVARALDPEGSMLKEEITFGASLLVQGSSTREVRSWEWKRRKDGSVWTTHLMPDKKLRHTTDADLGAYKWVVTAEHPKYGEVSSEYVPGPESEVELQFGVAATIEFYVDGLSAHAAGDSVVAAIKLPGDYRPRLVGKRPSAGSNEASGPDLVIEGIQPGDVHCGIMLSTGSSKNIPLAGRAIRLQSGVNVVRFSMPALYPVAVRVSVTGAEGVVGIAPKGKILGIDGIEINGYEAGTERPLSRTGEAQFPFLPAGTYVASYYERTTGNRFQTEFMLPGPATVVIGDK